MATGLPDWWSRIQAIISMKFLDLSDTPGSYAGQAGTVPEVTVTEDSLDWSAAKIDDHSARHENNGDDEISVGGLSGLLADDQHVLDAEVMAIKLDDFASPDDNTDLNVSTSKHGLCPKAPNDTTKYLRGDAQFATLAAASVSQSILKTSTGTWAVGINLGDVASIDLEDYSFFPKQRGGATATGVRIWFAGYPSVGTETYRIFAYRDSSDDGSWFGTYRYVASSEQIVDLMVDPLTGEIVGIHITEKGNEGSMRTYKDQKEIPMLNVVLDESFIEEARNAGELKAKPKFLGEIKKRGLKLKE